MSPLAAGRGEYQWILTTEDGKLYHGKTRGGETLPPPAKLPEGYHSLTLTQEGERWHCRTVVAPARCWASAAAAEKRVKSCGATCVQLYTLRSEKNWGIGDFGDLRAMLLEIACRGGSFIGLNPIHALYPANPESASPHSPSSRRWLNVIYIDVNAVEDFQRSEEAQAWWQSPATQQALQAARETDDDVDYTSPSLR
ncbi:4-alpha-glucanotransferase [Klebsiella pneumoniae]|nr:4-alpha-glucanotransferase [Klebsiella pneumoniae]